MLLYQNKVHFSCKAALAALVFGGFQLSDSQAMDDICGDPRELAFEAEQMHRELEQARQEEAQRILDGLRRQEEALVAIAEEMVFQIMIVGSMEESGMFRESNRGQVAANVQESGKGQGKYDDYDWGLDASYLLPKDSSIDVAEQNPPSQNIDW